MDRRDFLHSLAGLTAAIVVPSGPRGPGAPRRDRLGELLPTRRLGRTGEHVTMLGLGGWHIGRMSEKEAQRTIETALRGGVRFFDSAESYQNGRSEAYLGRHLVPHYRDVAFIMTKTTAPDAATARQHLEGSLRRLQTDYLDLWQVHSLQSPEDVDSRIDRDVLEVVLEAREEGKVRHIGFTGHASPAAHLRMLESTDIFETCQMPINVVDPSFESFVVQVLPVLTERNLGVVAMKTLANGRFFDSLIPDRVTVADALGFVWSLPVSVLVTGPDNPDQLQEKIDLARSFEGMSEVERSALVERMADFAGRDVEYYKT